MISDSNVRPFIGRASFKVGASCKATLRFSCKVARRSSFKGRAPWQASAFFEAINSASFDVISGLFKASVSFKNGASCKANASCKA